MPLVSSTNVYLAWAVLNLLTKRRYDVLRETFGSLEEAWKKLDANMLTQLGCKSDTISRTLELASKFNADTFAASLREKNIQFLSIEDKTYPDRLREIHDPPIFLFGQGNLALLKEPAIALVGTRAMSSYGKRVTELFTLGIVRAGLVTVSGLAIGIDAEVARQTLAAGGKHIAVLGNGIGTVFPPTNAPLAEEILSKGGLILSEFPPGVPPGKFTFPARNRIIAGLTLGTVVLEASTDSGSLITADLALDYAREVFAVPGQIFDRNFSGSNELIAKGCAHLVRAPEDVLAACGVITPESPLRSAYQPVSEEEEKILAALTTMPQAKDDITLRSDLPVASVNATLTHLELKGVAKNVGMGMWVRA